MGAYRKASAYRKAQTYRPAAAPQTLLPTGFSAGSFGTHAVFNYTQHVAPSGFAAGAFGAPTVFNYHQYIGPSGFFDEAFGTHFISLAIRRLAGVGLGVQTLFGTTFVSASIRTIDLSGYGVASLAPGFPTVDFRERQLFPVGFVATLYGTPSVDFHHPLAPAGWESMLFGAHEVHYPREIIDLAGHGFNAIGFGTARISNFWQSVFPPGISGAGQTEVDRFGDALVYNLTQHITQLFVVTVDDGGVFGNFNLVENRNKTIGAEGFDMARVGRPFEVYNNARIVTTPPFQDFSVFGSAMVSHLSRSVVTAGADTSAFGSPLNTIVYNAARQVFPASWDSKAFGLTNVFANRQFTTTIGFDMSLFGEAMVSFAVRTVAPFSIPGDGVIGLARVENVIRYIQPPGFAAGGFGVGTIEEHFTIIKPASVLPLPGQVSTGARVWNLTPEIHQQGATMTEWGRPAVRNEFEAYEFQGWNSALFGSHVVKDRRQAITVVGWNQFTMTNNHRIANVSPDPPSNRTIAPIGFRVDAVGMPSVRSSTIYPQGIFATLFGTAKIVSNGILPVGITPPYDDFSGSQFGTPSINRPSTVFVRGFDGLSWGVPDVGPRYIWAPQGYPYTSGLWQEIGHIMDYVVHGSNHPERPVFGTHSITHRNRSLFTDGSFFGEFGTPSLALSNQYIIGAGFKTQRFGFPVINGGGGISAYGHDMSVFGDAFVSIADVGDKTISAQGINAGSFGVTDVQNLNRAIYPIGWVEFSVSDPVPPSWPRASTWVSNEYPPFEFVGFDASLFGMAWVSHRIRTIYPAGADMALVNEYTPGQFADRMRVRRRDGIGGEAGGITLGSTLLFGTPTIWFANRTVRPAGFAAGRFDRQNVRSVNSVNVAGWESMLFGDVQQWEAGKVKPHGDEMSLFGTARIDRAIGAQGWIGEVGMPSVSYSFGAQGQDHAALGFPVITANVCGRRALAVPGFAAGAVGTPAVAPA